MLWMSYFKFCKSVGYKNSVNPMLVRMLQVHGDDPNLWILASDWELHYCSSAENARQFLWRGLRSHPECSALYLTLFRLELICINEKRKEEAEAKEAAPVTKRAEAETEPILNEDIPTENNILEGRLAKVVYESAVNKIVNVEFVIELINIAKEYDFTTKLQSSMIEDLLVHPQHSRNELVWDMLARRELEGLGYRTATGATLFEEGTDLPDKESKITQKEKIKLCVLAYKSFIKRLSTKRMWSFYLDALIELNQDLACLPKLKQRFMGEGFQEAHSASLLEEKYYWQWVDFLNGTEATGTGKVLREATLRFPSNLQLWEMRLSHHLSRDEDSVAEEVLQQAVAKLPSDSEATLPLWTSLIEHYKAKKSPQQAQKVFEKALKLGSPVSCALRPVFIEWLLLTKGVGRGTTTTQIMYHQQSSPRLGTQSQGRPSNTVQQSLPSVASTGYSSQQSSTPAYSTQPKPLSQSFTPANNTYEYQTQPPQPSQLSTPQQPPATQFQTSVAVNMELPASNVGVGEGGVDSEMDTTGEAPKRPWIKKKIPGFKVNKKIKRRRQNARLRKILQPKNAIMVLNELKAGVKFTFTEQSNALIQTLFVVNVEVDGKNHIGQGLSKPLAKQNAAENALKVLLLEKMTLAASKPLDGPAGALAMETESPNNGTAADNIDTMSVDGDDKPGAPDDEVPWRSLASFALFKLLKEWQSHGTHVPIAKQTATPTAVPAKRAPMKQLPDNPTDRHPVTLLSQMRPGVKFTEKSRDGTTFTLEVTVDGISYEGLAKNKKDAKKEAAKAALAGIFGTVEL